MPSNQLQITDHPVQRKRISPSCNIYRHALYCLLVMGATGCTSILPPVEVPYTPGAITLYRAVSPLPESRDGRDVWYAPNLPSGHYRLHAFNGSAWEFLNDEIIDSRNSANARNYFFLSPQYNQVELVLDKRSSSEAKKSNN